MTLYCHEYSHFMVHFLYIIFNDLFMSIHNSFLMYLYFSNFISVFITTFGVQCLKKKIQLKNLEWCSLIYFGCLCSIPFNKKHTAAIKESPGSFIIMT